MGRKPAADLNKGKPDTDRDSNGNRVSTAEVGVPPAAAHYTGASGRTTSRHDSRSEAQLAAFRNARTTNDHPASEVTPSEAIGNEHATGQDHSR